MGIGKLRCHVIDVADLEIAEAFYSELTGLPVIGAPPSTGTYRRHWTDRFSYLGRPDPWQHEIILQKVDRPKDDAANRSHIDIHVADVDDAIAQVETLGGSVKKAPSIYPRPGSFEGEPPAIDWAVMCDPFGNEFCLVSILYPHEVKAVLAATDTADGSDQHWRRAAGRTH
ncbi:MAG: VOC family protein [Acidimicrobiia bacterium]|nr:VOC family protein [Acidimicrobiia bacterium]